LSVTVLVSLWLLGLSISVREKLFTFFSSFDICQKGEIAPPTVRGSLGTCVQFALVIGILCATVFTYPLGSPSTWRFLFLVTPLIALCGLLISPSLLESPKWLLLRNNQLSRARHVIRLLRGYRSDDDVDLELESVSFACGLHSEKKCLPPEPSLWALLTTSNQCLRRSVAMILLFQICQQFSGINIVFYYSSRLLEGLISSPLMGTILLSVVNVAATYLSLVLMDHTKRRTLLIISDSGMLLSLFITTLALYSNFIPNLVAFLGLIVFVVLFELGLGPIPLLIAAELFDVGSVGSAMSLACICHWICNFLVGISFPFLLQQLGARCFLPYLFLLMAGLIFILVFFDEKPCSPKEIQGYLKPVIIAEHSSAHAEEKPISDESF
jgi:MFS transporter, SP family, solute carrier family 2 (facilitated glucose transporter), member 3